MTKRERFLAYASFDQVDRVPRRASYVNELRASLTQYLGEDPIEHFDMDDLAFVRLRPPDEFEWPDYSIYHPERTDGEDGFTIDANGCGHLGHGFHHFTEYISPLRNATRMEEIEVYPIVNTATWLDHEMQSTCRKAQAEGRPVAVGIGHMYESAWQVRGYEPFLVDLLTNRDWAELLLDRFCENNRRSAAAGARAGCDCLWMGDDVANQNAMMFHPDLWREVMKPRWASVIQAARDIKPDIHAWYHSDGNVWDILDDLIEIGINILNPVQPECMDPLAIRKRFGKRLAFDGCVGTQTTFPFGTPGDMRRRVHELADTLDARNGGLMLSPTHVLEPEVPPQNVIAFFEACDEIAAGTATAR
jgi:uroporphyrinogen decarboxylase